MMSTGSGLSVSVALATHNGERFLAEQLSSLAAQTRPPAELVVYDDCSTDGTVALIERFARTAPFEVRLLEGQRQLGHAEAFLRAAAACRGDLVAFCDQDDVWLAHKLARCVSEFEREPQLTLVVHSAALIDSVGQRLPGAFPAFRRRRVLSPARAPVVPTTPGFAAVITRDCIEAWDAVADPPVTRFGPACWSHDTWTAFVACALGKIALLPDLLVLYRQHESNVYGAPSATLLDRGLRAARRADAVEEFRG